MPLKRTLLMISLTTAPPLVGAASAAERWRRPLPDGRTIGSFSYDRADPYAGGRRRGIDLRGDPGSPVLAACAGRVSYAGPVPGRRGRGVTLRCGGLVATELGLGSVSVARGEPVASGQALGRLSSDGVLRLGARVAGDRHGYVDPPLDDDHPAPTPIAPPAEPPRPSAPPLVARRAPVAPAAATASPHPVWPPLAALGLAAAGAATRMPRRARRRHRMPAPEIAIAQR
jgi:hypothetical protein